jgi:hypothetical protein
MANQYGAMAPKGNGKGRRNAPKGNGKGQQRAQQEDWEERRWTNQQWHANFSYTIVEKGEEKLPLFQVALHRSFQRYEPEETQWLNFYYEWQVELAQWGPGVYFFGDWPWQYEVTILSSDQIHWWDLPDGWEPFKNEMLIVGWQRNLTKSPEQRRPVRRIDWVVDDFYETDLSSADYYYSFY